MKETFKNIKDSSFESKKITNTIKTGGSFVNLASLTKGAFGSVIFILVFVYFMSWGLPPVIGISFITFIVLLNVIGLFYTKRVIETNTDVEVRTKDRIDLYTNEQINLIIGGIMRTGLGIRGYEILGRGKNLTPENAMIITNKRVYFVTVPVAGAETMVSGTDIGMWQWVLSSKDIKNKLDDMVEKGELSNLLNSSDANYFVDLDNSEISAGTNLTQKICFKANSKKICYSIRDKSDFIAIKEHFHL